MTGVLPVCEDSFILHNTQSSSWGPFHLWARSPAAWGPGCRRRVCASFVNTPVVYLGIWQPRQETSSHFPLDLWTPHTNYQLFGCNFFLNFFSPLPVNFGLIWRYLEKIHQSPHPQQLSGSFIVSGVHTTVTGAEIYPKIPPSPPFTLGTPAHMKKKW